ncbi:unnamed protein product, partial [Polarella glacialis]
APHRGLPWEICRRHFAKPRIERWENMKPIIIRPTQRPRKIGVKDEKTTSPKKMKPLTGALAAWQQCLLEPLDDGGLSLARRAQELESRRAMLERRCRAAHEVAASMSDDRSSQLAGAATDDLKACEVNLASLRERLRARKLDLRWAPPEAVPAAAVEVVKERLALAVGAESLFLETGEASEVEDRTQASPELLLAAAGSLEATDPQEPSTLPLELLNRGGR